MTVRQWWPACPVPGCPGRHSPGHLMCQVHWRTVSRAARREVLLAHRRYETMPGPELLARLRAAQRAALAEVDA